MKMIPFCVLTLTLAAAGVAESQTFSDVSVSVRGYIVTDDGGETSEVSVGTDAVVVGQAASGAFSIEDCGHFHVSSVRQFGAGEFKEKAVTGWRVEIRPTRVVGDAVTFRLRWVRALDGSKAMTPTSEDVELTLRPGESRPMDSVPVSPGGKTLNGAPCKTSAASLRVTVDRHPMEEVERRLIAADLWLIERTSNGTERSQALSLRGLPNRPVPFYFDSIVDGTVSLDIFGKIVARPATGAMEVSIETVSRWRPSSGDPDRHRNPTRWVDSVIHVKPDEIVQVGLPKLGDYFGPFATRTFSIRIRARQVR